MGSSLASALFVFGILAWSCAGEGRTVLSADRISARELPGSDDSEARDRFERDGRCAGECFPVADAEDVPAQEVSPTEATPVDAADLNCGPDGDLQDALSQCFGDPACDDSDPCTIDGCEAGKCTHLLLPSFACCHADADCDDGVACTDDLCLSHSCHNILESNLCCSNTGDCDDLEPCTLDLCVADTCTHVFVASEGCLCSSWLDCDDGQSCTSGTCKTGECIYEMKGAVPGCCATVEECDDGNPQTQDSCVQFTCSHEAPTPCIEDPGCDDGDPCTKDFCALPPPCDDGDGEGGGGANGCDAPCEGAVCPIPQGACQNEPAGGCCAVDGQCDDGLAGTVDRCLDHQCFHLLEPWPQACATSDACDDANPCTLEECMSALCTYALAPGGKCCSNPAACDDGDPCTEDACVAFQCVHAPADGPVLQIHWPIPQPTLPSGFAVSSDGSSVKWQVSSIRSVSAPYSLYFGDVSGPTIDNGKKVKGELLTEWVAIPAASQVWLRFWLFLVVEPLYSTDQLTVHVNDGSGTVQVFDKSMIGGSTGSAWKQVAVDLGKFSGKKVRLELRFDSVDALNNDYEGVYVDDIDWSWSCGTW
ncbi:MAG: hypothetical protein FJ109_10235 [Deltaproteobacteria bacterium]|nr:hypothetical protein [Deltaproteobacteria bacterium]